MNHPSIPVADQNGKSIPSDVRTSLGTFIPRSYDKIVDRIEKRVAEVTQLPASESWTSWIGESRVLLSLDCGSFTNPTTVFIIKGHQESLQILRYRAGERYEPHFDWFNDAVSPEDAAGGKWMSTSELPTSRISL